MNVTRVRRAVLRAFWRAVNPLNRVLAGWAPWWVLLETTGNRSGKLRRTPLAAGPRDADGMWLISVLGHRCGWVRNLGATPAVRLRHRGRWRTGIATVHDIDPTVLARFNAYARSAATITGIDPKLVRISYGGFRGA